MRRASLLLLTALLGAVAFAFQPSATAQTSPSRVFDGTFACTTLVHAGIRKITVYATSVVRGQTDYLGRPELASAGLYTGGIPTSSPGGNVVGGATLAAASAGEARREGGAYFAISGKQCKPSSRRVPLAPQGLDGGAASPLGSDRFECFPPRTILLRARAVFRTPTRLRLDRRSGQLSSEAAVRQASFAATTLSGKPLVYAEILDSGKARLFTSRGCVPD